VHDSPVSTDFPAAELLALVGEFADVARRQTVASALAQRLGGEQLLVFAADPELNVMLPAPGLPQVLHGAAEWRAFLEACVREGVHAGRVPVPAGEAVQATGIASADGSVAVLLGSGASSAGLARLRPLLPLLGALARAERQITAHEVRARSATDAIGRANTLTRTLQEMRQRLGHALAEAEQARAEARVRAEQAESLAAELQAQALQLQEQAAEVELLNDELVRRTEEAEHARTAADEASRAKSEFLANMSHELRTPINAIIGYTELLGLGITGPVTTAQQAQLERIRVSSSHLLGLINDVLDLAKVEARQMTVEHQREPVAAVVDEAVALVEMQAVEQQLRLRTEGSDADATYLGDRARVRQILANLLSNAVKFTDAGGLVSVRYGGPNHVEPLSRPPGEGPWVCIAVEDSGIGMAAHQLALIFQPFVQAESGLTRGWGGTGLGLTISRQLARLMGGDLTVRSEPGKGSCFTLWLPTDSLRVSGSERIRPFVPAQ
jgi:signal transduction histidine kinase